mmetsp:Transcript_22606/g.33769  ORF Transcript_22606/g.33769 Transcript_22606/m.33769 type:complete len:110 (+) Transcript_22606:680-1009(+)
MAITTGFRDDASTAISKMMTPETLVCWSWPEKGIARMVLPIIAQHESIVPHPYVLPSSPAEKTIVGTGPVDRITWFKKRLIKVKLALFKPMLSDVQVAIATSAHLYFIN